MSEDAPADGAVVPPAPVTLTVMFKGEPVPGITTYFVNPDNSLVAMVPTSAQGVASAVIADGGSVTAINPFGAAEPNSGEANQLRTFAGVKAGDQLTLAQSEDRERPASITTGLSFPETPSSNSYDVYTTCGSTSVFPGGALAATTQMGLSGCNNARTDFLVVARPIEAGTSEALYRADVSVTDGGNVDLNDATYGEATKEFRYVNLGVRLEDSRVEVARTFVTPRGALRDIRLGEGFVFEGGVVIDVPEPGIADATATIVDSRIQRNTTHHVIEREPATAGYTLDGARLLPDLSGRFFPQYIATSRQVVWEEVEDDEFSDLPDLTIAEIDVFRGAELQGAPSGRWHWVVAAPYKAGKLDFPVLPRTPDDWTPTVFDDISLRRLVNVKVPGGYDAVRGRVHNARSRQEFSDLDAFVAAGLIAAATDRIVTVELNEANLGARTQAVPTGPRAVPAAKPAGLARQRFTPRPR